MIDVFDQQTLELSLKASNEGIWDWHTDSDQIFYSQRIIDFLGHQNTPPNIMTHPERIVHEDNIKQFKEELSLSLKKQDANRLRIDCKIIRPDGRSLWIRIRGTIIRDQDIAVRVVGSMIDISKRKFAEEMVAEEQHMLRLIIDNIPLQVFFKDTKSHYKLVNQRQTEWLGKSSPSEVLGKSGESFFSPESWQATRQEDLKIMTTGSPVIDAIQKEQWPNKPDSYVQKVKHPWYDRSDQLLGTYGIACDVTNLITAKKKLEKLALNLQLQNKNHQEELMLATEIQRAILPDHSPEWASTLSNWQDKISIDTLYIPASELAGDFYDIITISNKQIGFLIIDVIGQGVRSAIIASLIRGLMEQAEHLASKPALYLEEINNGLTSILNKASINLFASACYILMDFESNKISITSAGHDFPLIQLNSEKSIHPTKSIKGPSLGSIKNAHYSEITYPLENVTNILLFTDGIYETSNSNNKKWGKKNLQLEFNRTQTSKTKSTIDHIYQEATEWTGHAQFKDDICLLNIEIVKNKS